LQSLITAQDWPAPTLSNILAPLALLAALLLGGGGSPAPLPELLAELAVAGLAAAWLWQRPADTAPIPWSALVLAALCLILPLLQLVPLPPILWQALPGREAERAALALIGEDTAWRSWSITPARTLAALLAAMPPVAILLLTASAPPHVRRLLPVIIASFALLSLLLGAAQLAGGDFSPLRLYAAPSRFLDGFQANHNSTADLLLIGMIASALALRLGAQHGMIPARRGVVLGLAAGTSLLLALGTVLTASRTGIALMPLALVATTAILRPWLAGGRRQLFLLLVIGAALGGLAALALHGNDALNRVTARFDFAGELRPQIWRDALHAGQQAFPFGVGMGNFQPALLAAERLEVVRPALPNRAHNEALELLVEGGAAALALAGAALALVMARLVTAWRRAAGENRAELVFAGTALLILIAHSLTDYPLRSLALASLAAGCAGIILALAEPSGNTQ